MLLFINALYLLTKEGATTFCGLDVAGVKDRRSPINAAPKTCLTKELNAYNHGSPAVMVYLQHYGRLVPLPRHTHFAFRTFLNTPHPLQDPDCSSLNQQL